MSCIAFYKINICGKWFGTERNHNPDGIPRFPQNMIGVTASAETVRAYHLV